MDVFAVAEELLGGIALTSGQLGQIRALDYRLLLESVPRSGQPSMEEEEISRALVVTEIIRMLTPEQRAKLELLEADREPQVPGRTQRSHER